MKHVQFKNEEIKEEKGFYLPVNIQFFGDGEGAPEGGSGEPEGGSGQENYDYSQGWGNDNDNPLLGDDNPEGGDPQGGDPEGGEPNNPNPEPQGEEFDFGGRKIKVTDPNMIETLKGLHNDYNNLNGYATRTSQQLKTYEQQMQTYQQMQQNGMNQQNQQPQNQEPQGTSQEDINKYNEEYLERFYENPYEADKWKMTQPVYQAQMKEQMDAYIKPHIEPYETRDKWNNAVSEAQREFQDFEEMKPKITEVAKQFPEMAQDPANIKQLYYMAKGMSGEGQQQQQSMNPQDLLKDPNFVNQILQNENIRNQVISQYANNKQQTNSQIPPIMGGHAGGQPPSMPEDKPKTISDATQRMMKWLGG
jgi:hypothetical protein